MTYEASDFTYLTDDPILQRMFSGVWRAGHMTGYAEGLNDQQKESGHGNADNDGMVFSDRNDGNGGVPAAPALRRPAGDVLRRRVTPGLFARADQRIEQLKLREINHA